MEVVFFIAILLSLGAIIRYIHFPFAFVYHHSMFSLFCYIYGPVHISILWLLLKYLLYSLFLIAASPIS